LIAYWLDNEAVGTNIVFNVTDAGGLHVQSTVLTVVANPALSRQSTFSDMSTLSLASAASVSRTATITPTITASGSSSTSPTSSDKPSGTPTSSATPTPSSNGGSKSNAGAIAGGVVGGVVGLAALVLLALYLRKRQRDHRYEATAQSPLQHPMMIENPSVPPSSAGGPVSSSGHGHEPETGVGASGVAMNDDEAYYNRVIQQQAQQQAAHGQPNTQGRYGGLPEL